MTVTPGNDVPMGSRQDQPCHLGDVPSSLSPLVNRLLGLKLVCSDRLRRIVESLQTMDGNPAPAALLQRLIADELLTAHQSRMALHDPDSLLLGSYQVLEPLGQGGMGEVFKARHLVLRHLAAVKVLRADLLKESSAIQRFKREIVATGRLKHPNIVSAIDVGEAGGRHFLVLEFVSGRDLERMVEEDGPMHIGRALKAIRQVASGLQFAHDNGVIHRDVKPSNIILGVDGMARLLDLGVARTLADIDEESSVTRLTATGHILGTIAYMAPEQAMDSKRADARSDIYSLGCTLYYLVKGTPPYQFPNVVQTLVAHRELPVPTLQPLRSPYILPQIDLLFQKMLAKEPAQRFQSMAEVVSAIEACRRPVPFSTLPEAIPASAREAPDAEFILLPTSDATVTPRSEAADPSAAASLTVAPFVRIKSDALRVFQNTKSALTIVVAVCVFFGLLLVLLLGWVAAGRVGDWLGGGV